jgi:hypothetical protein
MGLLRWIACRWIPPGAKASTTARLYFEFLKSLVENKNLDEDDPILDEISAAAAKVGEKLAFELAETFKLGNTITDAVDAWKIGCVAANLKFRVERDGDKYIFHHPHCPMHAYFTVRGIVPCNHLCLPMVKSIAETICLDCEVEFVREGTIESTCIKLIKPKASGDSH